MTTTIPLLLALVQNDDEGIPWKLLVWVVIFFVLPTAGKVISWVMGKLSPVGGEKGGEREQRRERRTEAREAQSELEARGLETWHELSAGGEDAVETPVPPRAPSPRPVPRAVPAPASVLKKVDLPSSMTRDERVPLAPLAPALGLPSTLPADIEDTQGERFGTLSTLDPRRRRDWGKQPPETPLVARGDRTDWRRAIVLSEVLASPVALRDPEAPGGPPGLR